MKTRVVVVAVIENDGKILLGKKAKGVGPYPDAWQIPGGGANLEEESLTDALKREIREEVGIEIDNIRPVGFDEDTTYNKLNQLVHYVFLQFYAQSKSDKVTPGDDIEYLEWVEKSNLENYNLCKPLKKLFKRMELIK
ncbi:MAG: hypothetical protein A2152_01780 [Candidatus Levybacteria bacterium RBG_16_35_6]|nr:MAG: hypothetical protein A2152_01780 [Candidatus Levybacteria bacterium RBG_16_35_6]